MKKLVGILCIAFAITLSGCGGGSDSTPQQTNNGQATLDNSNSDQFVKAAIEAVSEISSTSSVNTTIPTGSSSTNSLALNSRLNSLDIQALATNSYDCEVSGSFSIESDDNGLSNIVYNNCNDGNSIIDGSFEYIVVGNSITINYDTRTTVAGIIESMQGTITFVTSDDGDTSTTVYNFTTSIDGVTETYDATYTCTGLTSSTVTCRFSSPDYEIDGTTFTYEQTGDATTVNGIYECPLDIDSEDDGYVSVVASGIENDCTNTDYPSSGSITFTDATDNVVMTINFIDCSQFSVEFDGSVTTYNYAEFF